MSRTRLPESAFVYAVCQLGAEAPLKAEVARLEPEWRFAFSRPGLVTWKSPAPVSVDLALGAVLARCHGLSLGRARSKGELNALLQALAQPTPLALHVFERDRAKPGDEKPGDVYGPLAATVREQILAFDSERHWHEGKLKPGDLVLDVVVAPDEPWLIGVHRHGTERSAFPGARPMLTIPTEAPSRAWLKLEEGLAFSQMPVRAGEVAVEIGSAPGGASYALLQRQLQVIGVDPGEMAENVLAEPAFTHLKLKLSDLRREQLPDKVDWLLLDVNLAPAVALHQLRRIVGTLKTSLRGALLTLKLNDWKMAEKIPSFLTQLTAMGFHSVRATQLASNRQEICVAARMKGPQRSR